MSIEKNTTSTIFFDESDNIYSSSANSKSNYYSSDYETTTSNTGSTHSSLSTDNYTDSLESEDNPFYGKILDKNYFIIAKLGSGSFSSVWLSYSLKHDTLVAIKISNEEDCDEAIKEYDFVTNNNIPNIINFIDKFSIFINYEADSDDSESEVAEQICIVMPLMICSVYDLLKLKDSLSTDIVKKVVYQIGSSIKTLHKLNYIHTDIKPENILVKSIDGNDALIVNNKFKKLYNEIKNLDLKTKLSNISDELKLEQINEVLINFYNNLDDDSIDNDIINSLDDKVNIEFILIDFGSIKINNNDQKSIQQTRYYRAPEILLRYNWNETIDIWSFGCVIYELLTGNLLIDPDKDDQYDRNIYHINYCEIISNSQGESKKYFESGLSYNKYYNSNGFLINKIHNSEIDNLMKDERILNDTELYNIIINCIQFNPKKRKLNI